MAEGLRPLSGPDDPRLRPLRAALGTAVLLDPDGLHALSGDASTVPPTRPGAAVLARRVEDVATAMAWAHQHRVPVTPRGAGTGKAGGCVPDPGGLVLSLAALTAIRALRPEHGWAEVEPGLVTGTFRAEMEAHGLFYPPDPASLDRCTLGGNVATNAGGPVALAYGVTGRHVLGLTAVLPDGAILETGRRQAKDVAGLDLTSLLVGSEGRLAVLVGLRLALLPVPREVRAATLGFAALSDATSALVDARRAGVLPRAMELIDSVALARVRRAGGSVAAFGLGDRSVAALLVEVDGPEGTADRCLAALLHALRAAPSEVLPAATPDARAALWEARRAMSRLVKEGAAGFVTEDIAVPLGVMAEVVERLHALAADHRLTIATYGHAGDGNLHVNVLWDQPEGEQRVPALLDAVMALAIAVGGTITGEHGVGRAKARWLPAQLGPRNLTLQRAIKAAWDPRGILNPGLG